MKLMRCVLLPAVSMLLCSALVLGGTAAVLSSTMPPFRDSVGDHNDTEKITGEYLVELSAAQDDTLLIFGSSELRTTYIPTHPANFFADKRAGFQVDLIGRGLLPVADPRHRACRLGRQPARGKGGAHHLAPVLCAGGHRAGSVHGKLLRPAVPGPSK